MAYEKKQEETKAAQKQIKILRDKIKGNNELIKYCKDTGRTTELKRWQERNKELRACIELLKFTIEN